MPLHSTVALRTCKPHALVKEKREEQQDVRSIRDSYDKGLRTLRIPIAGRGCYKLLFAKQRPPSGLSGSA